MVYNHFDSKDAVFRAVMDRYCDSIRAEVAAIVPFSAAIAAMATELAEILCSFARAIFQFLKRMDQIAFTRLVIGGEPSSLDR
ncbi:TCP11 family protein [Methylobacterium sp. Leaf361]|uniref:TCP11 family protein n=1 Tax=Methylobacterium sp. Leaf361 TaxID=1736352 RepID=UPI000B2AC79F|nr:TCP11 family protein [Methylobacterium sp. Leaf361]